MPSVIQVKKKPHDHLTLSLPLHVLSTPERKLLQMPLELLVLLTALSSVPRTVPGSYQAQQTLTG